MPAALTATSSPPSKRIASATTPRACVSLARLPATACTATPGQAEGRCERSASAVRCALAELEPAITTSAHSLRKPSAAAKPIPLEPPVTSTFLPAKRLAKGESFAVHSGSAAYSSSGTAASPDAVRAIAVMSGNGIC